MEIIPHMERTLPVLILVLIGYVTYAYCYEFSWKTVDNSGKAGGLIAGYCIILSLMLTCWIQVLVIGPGEIDESGKVSADVGPDRQQRTDLSLENLPEVFACDPQGYRQWCSTCQRIKPDRAHHSGQKGRCIPKMDHYCAWMFAVLGLRNFRFFLQFLTYVCILCLYIILTVAGFANKPSKINRPTGSLYGVGGFLLILLGAFTGFHYSYVLTNQTTIEHMSIGNNSLPIYNICLEDGVTRIVTRLYRDDVNKIGPYNNGPINNWKNAMGNNVFQWVFPVPINKFFNSKTGVRYDDFNPKLLRILRDRFSSGEEGYLAFVQPQKHRQTNN